jgi:hypothetical protein
MTEQLYILFCESPVEQNGFLTLIFNFEDLTSQDRTSIATKRIKPSEKLEKVIYRGWMLTPKQYSILYNNLLTKNYQLVNAVEEYQNCHYLPDSLKFIESRTPKTVFEKFDTKNSIDKLIEKSKVFGQKSVALPTF